MKPTRKPVAKTRARARSAAATSGSQGATGSASADAKPAVMTTFPAGSCDTRLPVSESFHDVTFGEFKRLNVTVDNVLLPLVLGDVDRGRLAKPVSDVEIKNIAKLGARREMIRSRCLTP